MNRTTTRMVNLKSLQTRNGSATVIRLMMACNDLSLANDAQEKWKSETSPLRKSRANGAQMYFVRLQVSHLNEALKVIADLSKNEFLMTIVNQCDLPTQNSFNRLSDFLPRGVHHKEFERIAGRIRSNLGFHYDESGKLIEKALKNRGAINDASTSAITRGSTAHLWHFELADEILDRIVVREIWKIPDYTDLRVEADKMADWIHNVLLLFVDFCGEFIWKFVER